MKWALFIDDLRNLSDVKRPDNFSWYIARTMEDAIEKIEELGPPCFVSFDHDLGEDDNNIPLKTGHDFANWLVNQDIDKKETFLPCDFDYQVHSANPVGRANIEGLLSQWLRVKREMKNK